VLHSNIIQTNVILTQESVYGDSPSGKLENQIGVLVSPHHKGFNGDGKAGFSVRIDNLPAFALKDSVIGTMSLPNSTAVGTPLGGVPIINYSQRNIIIKASCREYLPEFVKGDSHNFSIEIPAFWRKSLEFFNSNLGIESFGYFDNLPNCLSEIGFNKVSFGFFKPSKFSGSIKRLQQGSPFHQFSAPNPDAFAKIRLVKDFAIRRNNGNCKMLGVYINSKNVLLLRNYLFFGKICNNLPIRHKPISFANPSFLQERRISLPTSVLFKRNANTPSCGTSIDTCGVSGLSGANAKRYKGQTFIKSLAISWNIEFYSYTLDFVSLGFHNRSFNIADKLGAKGGVFLAG
jgi:hypothetical protein